MKPQEPLRQPSLLNAGRPLSRRKFIRTTTIAAIGTPIILSCSRSKPSPNGKLRLLFELNPMAYLIENAGGAATNGKVPILDLKPECLDQRAPIYIGCIDEVNKAMEYVSGE